MRFLCLMLVACSAAAQLPTIPSGFNFPPKSSSGTANLVLWVKSTQNVSNSTFSGSPPSNGNTVGGIGDLSGNNHHLAQSIGAKQPVYNSSGGGGNSSPYISFSNGWLTNRSSGISASGTNTFILAIYDGSASATQWIMDTGGSGAPTWYSSFGAPYLYHMNSGGSDFAPASPQPFMAQATWHVVTLQFAGANSFARVDGTNVLNWSGNAGSGTGTQFDVGTAYNGTSPALIRFMEIQWWNGYLSVSDIHTKEQTIGTSYAITVN